MIALTCCASSCCMFDTCTSGVVLSSSAITLQPSAFACATTASCKVWSVSLPAIGFWKPIVQAPLFFTGVGYCVGSDASTPLYPFGPGTPAGRPDAALATASATTAAATTADLNPCTLPSFADRVLLSRGSEHSF